MSPRTSHRSRRMFGALVALAITLTLSSCGGDQPAAPKTPADAADRVEVADLGGFKLAQAPRE